MNATKWAVVDRFGNSAPGLGCCVSVHKTEDLAEAALARWDRAVRRGHGRYAHTGWAVEEVPADTRKGDRARPVPASDDAVIAAGRQLAAEYPREVWEEGAGEMAMALAVMGDLPFGMDAYEAAERIYASALEATP
jgi:hypothetical protein